MDQYYSTLELVKYDETARCPERDYDATAFELDAGALAPQVVPDATPQVCYDDSYPETHGKNDQSPQEHAPINHTIKPEAKWLRVIVVFAIAAAMAVGVGVGVSRYRRHSSFSPPTSKTPAQFILNDTSLAALCLPGGDRQLFFQDTTGLIRRAIFLASDNQWSTNPYLNVSSNPKIYTPLAVIIPGVYSVHILGLDPQITLYYVSESNVLNSSTYEQGAWTSDNSLEDYITAVDTRSLSVASIASGVSDTNSTSNSALLYYEDPTGQVSALLQRGIEWFDITSQDSKSLPNEFRNVPAQNGTDDLNSSKTLTESNGANPIAIATFSHPFTFGANGTGQGITALLFLRPIADKGGPVPDPSIGSIMYNGYIIGPSGPGNFTEASPMDPGVGDPPPLNYSSILQSDIATFGPYFGIWVNGTQPVVIPYDEDMPQPRAPDNTFPFTRLATAESPDQSATYLYHQINGTTFAEEQWDNSAQEWLPSEYIIVSDS